MMADEQNAVGSEQDVMTPCKTCGKLCEESSLICDECRNKFIRYPIPKKVLTPLIIVSCIVAVLFLIRFPGSLQAGVYYERALKSIELKNYVDAELELDKAYRILPDSPEITGNLAVCAYMNSDMEKTIILFDQIYNKQMAFNDEALYRKLSNINEQISIIFDIPEEFMNNYEKISQMQISEKITELHKYNEKYPDSVYIKMALADILFDEKQYDSCEKVVQQVLLAIPSYMPYQIFMAAIYREKGNFGAAESICLQFLNENRQSTYALSALSRIELKRFNDEKSLEYMETAYRIQPDDISVLLDLARSYYYNNRMEKLNSIMDSISKHPQADRYQKEILETMNIIEGRIQWR